MRRNRAPADADAVAEAARQGAPRGAAHPRRAIVLAKRMRRRHLQHLVARLRAELLRVRQLRVRVALGRAHGVDGRHAHHTRAPMTAAATVCTWSRVISGNIGSDSTSRAICSATGKSPA